MKIKDLDLVTSTARLSQIPAGKTLINTINAYSYNIAQKDEAFAEALTRGGFLIPDGASIVWACKWLKAKSRPQERIAGWDLFMFEMNALEKKSEALTAQGKKRLKVMFLGSSHKVLALIQKRASKEFPNLDLLTYSPPYKPEFSGEDSRAMINAINTGNPDLLWIGMTAPKQEKWVYGNWDKLNIDCHCGTIGAVFDFYAGTVRRAPLLWQKHALEWLYRLLEEPRRMWRRYLIGNIKFIYYVIHEKIDTKKNEPSH